MFDSIFYVHLRKISVMHIINLSNLNLLDLSYEHIHLSNVQLLTYLKISNHNRHITFKELVTLLIFRGDTSQSFRT